MDNSLKTSVSLLFDADLPASTITTLQMALRRSQIGHYGLSFAASETRRGQLSVGELQQFVESVLDVYHSLRSSDSSGVRDPPYFFLRGQSFAALFTREKSGVKTMGVSDRRGSCVMHRSPRGCLVNYAAKMCE